MNRRKFVTGLLAVPATGYATVVFAGAANKMFGDNRTSNGKSAENIQSFGYYEPLGENDTHDESETDGTDYDMPCISASDISAAADKEYEFWHGHGGVNHKFPVTAADFAKL